LNPVLELVNDEFMLVTNPRESDTVKQIPGARYIKEAGAWRLPKGMGPVSMAGGLFGGRLQWGPQIIEWGKAERARLAELEVLKTAELPFNPEGWAARLYDFQRNGSAWAWKGRRALLTDDMGTGKTVQLSSALKLIALTDPAATWPVLIICPNSMKHKWAEELEKWGPEHGGIVVVGGTPTQKRKQFAADASIWIINWESLFRHSRLAPYGSTTLSEAERTEKELDEIGFKTVIADEIHRACDPNAKQTRAWWNLSHKAVASLAASGTPIRNKPDDLWSIGHGLWPEDFATKSKWVSRYCHSGQNLYGGFEVWGWNAATQGELFSYLDPKMLRRTKAEVLPQLPETVFSTRYVELDPKQRKAYDSMEQEMMSVVDGDPVLAGTPLELRIRLTQLAGGTPVIEDGKVTALTKPSCKVDAMLDILDEAPGEPLVVFSRSRLLIELCGRILEQKKITHTYITGAVPPAERGQNVALFQEGEAQVALCTFGAGAEGITLTRANRMVRLDLSESMIQNKQAPDRINRIGQEAKKVEVIDLVALGTVEEDIRAASGPDGLKEENLEGLLRDRARRLSAQADGKKRGAK